MAACPFATQHPISGDCGHFGAGPFRIVHHTTEGSSVQAAFAAFATKKADPHFTVDQTTIYQHIDTGLAARALVHPPGMPETNRASAIQIEVVGFAGAAKNAATLRNVARLCRWIESEHAIARVWPAGPPPPAVNGRDPGGHRRDPAIWAAQGGHYGHCHVPENTHWDPAYNAVEAAYVLAASFDAAGHLTNPADAAVAALTAHALGLEAMQARHPEATVDHFDVGDPN